MLYRNNEQKARKMDSLNRRLERLKARAEDIDDMPLPQKANAVSILFADLMAFMGMLVQRVLELESRADG